MDPRRFDELDRSVVSTSSRRAALPAVVGALVGLPGIAAAQGTDRRGPAGGEGRLAGLDVVRKDARRFEQADPDGEDGPRASGKKKAKKQPIGIREIWYWENCTTTAGVRCVVTCPNDMQAIGGGAYNISTTGRSPFDFPDETVREWEVVLSSENGAEAWAHPYAVCLRK